MRSRELKRVLRENPDFAAWLRQDVKRLQQIRANPSAAGRLLTIWKQSNSRRGIGTAIDFEEMSRKTKRATDVLNKVQLFMDSMAVFAKEEYGKELDAKSRASVRKAKGTS
ncbi:MAG: hypothetical protein H0Z34_04180 [Brevibacillus sp.]|nr:hypothetical protein [Brevibacillus sp.]